MPVTRLNHAVLYVRDVEVTREFYEQALGLRDAHPPARPRRPSSRRPGSTNDHDLGVFQIGSGAGPSGAGRSTVGPVPPGLGGRHPRGARAPAGRAGRPRRAGRGVGPRDHQVALRPGPRRHRVRGLLDPARRRRSPRSSRPRPPADPRPRPLDLEAEKARYGGATRGGIGVSIPGVTAWPERQFGPVLGLVGPYGTAPIAEVPIFPAGAVDDATVDGQVWDQEAFRAVDTSVGALVLQLLRALAGLTTAYVVARIITERVARPR